MKKKNLFLALWSLLLPCTAWAQYTIYPIPHEQVVGTASVSFTPSVTLVAESGIDAATVNRAKQVLTDAGLQVTEAAAASTTTSNVYLGIGCSGGVADARATALNLTRDVLSTANKYDRHVLALADAGSGQAEVVALGENTDATFFALASLEQILDGGTQNLTTATLYDYADQKSRGIVEGYYGYPYSVSVKKDLMRFMMRYKMNTYLYGAKSDPYHSESWKAAYPTSITATQEKNGWLTQDMIKEIAAESQETKVNFIWAIHPGNNFTGSSTVITDIMGKFEKMHALGVRQFGVFVDDVSVPSDEETMQLNADRLTQLQQAIEAKWNTADAAASDTVRPLHFVPQIYCRSFASSQTQHDNFFKALSSTPSYITIYTTGNGVWSVPNESDLSAPATPLGRNVAWWWNYPCNDNADGQLYPMDMYSNFYDMPAVNSSSKAPTSLDNGMGVVSNPMQEGEVAKTPLFSVADMAWNIGAFDVNASWEASFKAVLPENEAAQAAYRYLAPYLRYNDPSALGTLISTYKSKKEPAALSSLMDEIINNCNVLAGLKDSEIAGESLLYTDLAPWLLKLRAMAKVTKELLATASDTSSDDARWTAYLGELKAVDSLSTAEEYIAYALEGMGSGISISSRPSQPSNLRLLPFISYLQENALAGFIVQDTKQNKKGVVTNVSGASGRISGNLKLAAVFSTPVTLHKGEYIGLRLAQPTIVKEITAQDTLVTNYSVVISPDGKRWTRMTETSLTPDTYVRYAVVVNDSETPKTLTLSNKSLIVNLNEDVSIISATIPEGTGVNATGYEKSKIYDGDYTTYACYEKDIAKNDAYKVTLSQSTPIHRVRLAFNTTNSDYMDQGRVEISKNDSTWTALKVLGTSTTTFNLSNAKIIDYDENTKLLDFEGTGEEAQYVRLLITSQTNKKWMRLAEIEVNGSGTVKQPRCEDALGISYDQITDADLATSTENAVKIGTEGTLTYYFQNLQLLDGVTFYCDPETMNGVTLSTTTDGSTWKSQSYDASTGVVRLTLTGDDRAVTALQFTWTGDKAPAVYELLENASTADAPVVSSIEQAETAAAVSALEVSLHSGRVSLSSAVGITQVEAYTPDGRCLMKQHTAGTSSLTLPIVRTASPIILRARLTNGEVQTYKLR